MIRRRSRCAFVIPFLVLGVLLAGCDWTQSRFGPDHTGFNAIETVINPGNVSELRMRWSQQVDNRQSVGASPTIANGVLYVVTDRLYAFDASTGSARWSTSVVGNPHSSSPAVAGGVVFVNGDELHAFDAASGVPLWSVAVEAEGSPTVTNGVVYVTGGDRLYAFDAATGATLWSAFVLGHGLPTVANGVVYVAGGDRLYAFDAETGAKIWIRRLAEGSLYGVAAVANGVIYVGGDRFRAYNATSGALLWTATTYGGSPAVANGVVYVGGDRLYAFNAATGAILWTSDPAVGFSYGSVAVANGVVYVSGDQLFAFNAATGARLWSAATRGRGDPVVANGVVYVADGDLHAYSLPSSTPRLIISPTLPADYMFGEPNSQSTTFTVTNFGSAPTSVITDTLTGPGATQFHLDSDGCSGARLAGGASCTVTASFVPTAAGSHTAFLTSAATAGGRATALLAGTAQPLTLSPRWTQVPDIFAGSTFTTTFTITNLAPSPIGPLTESITGNEFTITADACAGKTVTPGSTCAISVTFAPTASYDQSAVLVSEAPGYRLEALVQGRALARITVTPSYMAFGAVPVGTTKSVDFTVTNISPSPTNPLTETIEDVWGSDRFLITHDACAGRRLAVNASCTVTVTFAPLVGGSVLGRLRTATSQGGDSTAFLIGTT